MIIFIGSACRNKVLNTLRRKFKSPEEAEAHYFPLKLVASEPTEVAVAPSFLNSSENCHFESIQVLLQLIFKCYSS